MTNDYLVSWEIEVYAESPEDAALKCLAIQRDVNSKATVFVVRDDKGKLVTVDLTSREFNPKCN